MSCYPPFRCHEMCTLLCKTQQQIGKCSLFFISHTQSHSWNFISFCGNWRKTLKTFSSHNNFETMQETKKKVSEESQFDGDIRLNLPAEEICSIVLTNFQFKLFHQKIIIELATPTNRTHSERKVDGSDEWWGIFRKFNFLTFYTLKWENLNSLRYEKLFTFRPSQNLKNFPFSSEKVFRFNFEFSSIINGKIYFLFKIHTQILHVMRQLIWKSIT